MGLSKKMLETLARIGYEKPSPVQAGVVPLAMQEFDVIGQARTGTGKTAAFAIPILEQLDLSVKKAKPQALILTPTRELAVQVENEFKRLSDQERVNCVCLYGGRPIRGQINQLERGAHVVVGTPGARGGRCLKGGSPAGGVLSRFRVSYSYLCWLKPAPMRPLA